MSQLHLSTKYVSPRALPRHKLASDDCFTALLLDQTVDLCVQDGRAAGRLQPPISSTLLYWWFLCCHLTQQLPRLGISRCTDQSLSLAHTSQQKALTLVYPDHSIIITRSQRRSRCIPLPPHQHTHNPIAGSTHIHHGDSRATFPKFTNHFCPPFIPASFLDVGWFDPPYSDRSISCARGDKMV